MSVKSAKANSTAKSKSGDPERLTAELREYIESSKHSASLFRWEVGKRLDGISAAYKKGDFSNFMDNLRKNVGMAKMTGYDCMHDYRKAIQLFPQFIIEGMLDLNLLPNKRRVLAGAENSPEILNELKAIRSMKPTDAALWSGSVVTRIREAAARIKPPAIDKDKRIADSMCGKFRTLLSPSDPLYKKPKEPPSPQELEDEAWTLFNACKQALARCNAFDYLKIPAKIVRPLMNVNVNTPVDMPIEDREV
jgi:hypothetical protein